MTKSVPPSAGTCSDVTVRTTASGGASVRTRSANAVTAAADPSTSATTPAAVLATWPDRPSSRASA